MCDVCGMLKEDINERGIARLRHKLQIPKDIDFWLMFASEHFDKDPKEVTKEEREEVKSIGMRIFYVQG